MGYTSNSLGYRIWDPQSRKVYDVGGADFDEDVAPGWWKKQNSQPDCHDDDDDEPLEFDGLPPMRVLPAPASAAGPDPDGGDAVPDVDAGAGGEEPGDMAPADDLPYIAPPAEPRRSERGNRGVPATRFDEEIYVSSLSIEELGVPPRRSFADVLLASATTSTPDAPATYRDAVRGANGKVWREACAEELQSLVDNKVYRIVDRPKHKKVIGVRWVLRVKVQSDGEVERYKGRVVAKGYS